MPSLPPFANLLLLYCPPVYIAFSTFNAFKSHFSDYNFQIPPKVQFLCLLIILTPPSISICLLVSYISPDKFCISEFTSSLLESCGIYTFFSMLLVFYGGKQYIVGSSQISTRKLNTLQFLCLQPLFTRPMMMMIFFSRPLPHSIHMKFLIFFFPVLVQTLAVLSLISHLSGTLANFQAKKNLIFAKMLVVSLAVQQGIISLALNLNHTNDNYKQIRIYCLLGLAEMAILSRLLTSAFSPDQLLNLSFRDDGSIDAFYSPDGKPKQQSRILDVECFRCWFCNCFENESNSRVKTVLKSVNLNPDKPRHVDDDDDDDDDNDDDDEQGQNFTVQAGVIASTFSPIETAQEKFRSPVLSPQLKSNRKKRATKKYSYSYDTPKNTQRTPSIIINNDNDYENTPLMSTPNNLSFGSCASDGLSADV